MDRRDFFRKSGKGLLGITGLGSVVGLVGGQEGCVMRQGDEEVSAIAIPFVPAVTGEHKTYFSGTNRVRGRVRTSMSTAFGNVHVDVMKYGEDDRFEGRYKIRFDRCGDRYKVRTEVYDECGRMIDVRKGMKGIPDDIPLNIQGSVPEY